MRIIVYGDCMPIGPKSVVECKRYPGILSYTYKSDEIYVLGYSGLTTKEAVEKINEAISKKPDIIILAWGINDGLPRGLSREKRSQIIKLMYRLEMNERARLLWRKYLLNPLEYILQIVHKPKFYLTHIQTYTNLKYIINTLKKNKINKIILMSVNPVLNYRFIKANHYLKIYNDVIKKLVIKENIYNVDVFSKFLKIGINECLFEDKFHYSQIGHEVVAKEIVNCINIIQG